MCLIVHRPAEAGNLKPETITLAMTRHPDGFGLAWRQDGALRVSRFAPGHRGRKLFKRALRKADASGTEYVAHFRWATHGPTDAAHCHPFEYTDPAEGRVVVFHNGILNVPTLKHESDTEVFVREVLARLPSGWWRDSALRFLVTAALDGDRLVVMTATETITLNESRGEWDAGLWYSSEHRPPKPSPVWQSWLLPGSDKSLAYKAPASASTSPRKAPAPASKGPEVVTLPAKTPPVPVAARTRFWHRGHEVMSDEPLPEAGPDRTLFDALECLSCGQVGDYWWVDGAGYADVEHVEQRNDEDGAVVPRSLTEPVPLAMAAAEPF